jgi:hypothetical protein
MINRMTQNTTRRTFVQHALAALPILPALGSKSSDAQEVPTFRADVPPGATLWGLVVFTGDEPVEVTLAAGKSVRSIRGRFDAQRLTEYSWRNEAKEIARVGIRARALASERDLQATKIQFLSQQNVYVAFGRRGIPVDLADRSGGYPYEAVFVGFIVFE